MDCAVFPQYPVTIVLGILNSDMVPHRNMFAMWKVIALAAYLPHDALMWLLYVLYQISKYVGQCLGTRRLSQFVNGSSGSHQMV